MGKLWDVAIAPGDALPIVTGLLLKQGKRVYTIPWQRVLLFNPLVVSVAGAATDYLAYEATSSSILLRRDVLDKQIVDVNGAKVVRVNDVKLTPYEDLLCIFSVDIGFRGLLRRIGYERLWLLVQKDIPQSEIGWQFVNPLEINAAGLTLSMAREQLAEMHPADIAEIIANIPRNTIQGVLNSLDHETAGEAIHELEPELRSRIISLMDSEHASDILEEMPPDEAADILGDLPEEKAQELLRLMDREEAEEIKELMEHEEDTAGGLMNHEFVAISSDTTVGSALDEIKRQAEEIETIYYAYILDVAERLVGVVSLRELLIGNPDLPVSEIMTEQLKTVDVEAEPEDILALLAKYDLIAIPVLDEVGKMAGVVTIDDVVELFLPYALKRRRHHS
ncbi:MAG: magnesium transporter [Desulfuromonadales bacterium]|nr:magnesium transporter [Desulfuromonadales bacterium]